MPTPYERFTDLSPGKIPVTVVGNLELVFCAKTFVIVVELNSMGFAILFEVTSL